MGLNNLLTDLASCSYHKHQRFISVHGSEVIVCPLDQLRGTLNFHLVLACFIIKEEA